VRRKLALGSRLWKTAATMSPAFSARRIALGALFLVLGLGLLVWQVRKVGLPTIMEHLAQVGWGFLAILAISLLRYTLRSVAWITLIGERVSLVSALAATVSGDALGQLTPFSLIVSEPAKSLYLRDQVPPSRSLAALAAENFFYSASVALFVMTGTVTMLLAYALPAELAWLRWAGLAAIGMMGALLSAASWIAWRKPALASGTLSRVTGLKLGPLVERVRNFETRAYGFARQSHGRLGVVLACEAGFHVLSFSESYYTLWLLTGASSPLAAFVFDTFSRIVNIVGRPVVLKVGIDEYGAQLVASVVGLPSAVGVTLALVRKGRVLVWAAVGILLMVRKGLTVRQALERARE
jgi:hypothetical protein